MAAPRTQWFSSLFGSTESLSLAATKNREEEKKQLQVKEMKQQQQKQRRPPRFAVELDGINCFETIVLR
ncbi:hypothetical protein Cni_G18418 [Canna indica]|uniref:Uncharacterized protein n=1 Tax=Canna indica TaxID=4628 RepID=A0AAQ3KKQ8_9LILI|nr:hypothetical protein Cni_G18418 [Canna indica]